jgi:hypothetical protein
LRRFLIDTFGAECVGSGAPILDVGGGRGELAFELCNLNGADAVVVDVVPMRLARYESKLERGWYDRSAPLAKYNDRERRPSTSSAAYDARSTTRRHETPKHLRLLWSPALWRVRDDDAAEPPTASPTTRTIDVISSLERDLTAATRERHAVATYSAWAAATRVAFSARANTKKKENTALPKRADGKHTKRDGFEEDSRVLARLHETTSTTTVTDALLSFVHQHDDPSTFVRGASRADADPPCGASPPDSADADERVGAQKIKNTSEDDDQKKKRVSRVSLRVRGSSVRRLASGRVARARDAPRVRHGGGHAQRPGHGVDRGLRAGAPRAVRGCAVLRVSRTVSAATARGRLGRARAFARRVLRVLARQSAPG